MSDLSTIGSRVEDYNINENDKQALMQVWNEYAESDKSENNKTFLCRRVIIICKYLQNVSAAPLSKWTKNDTAMFISWLDVSELTTKGYLRIIKKVLETEGLPTTILDVDEITEANEVKKYYPNFETFNAILLSTFYRDREIEDYSTHMDKYATPRAVAYLAWLGLSLAEIDRIRNEDFNEEARCFIFENRVYSYAAYPDMAKFFKAYSSATGFYSIRGDRRKYYDSGLFIKITQSKGKLRSNALLSKFVKDTNLSYEQIHYSGMFERLYEYERLHCAGGKFTKDDIDDIQFIMRTNKPRRDFSVRFGQWLRKYNKYKELRETNAFDLF